jgi:hypothetical protein
MVEWYEGGRKHTKHTHTSSKSEKNPHVLAQPVVLVLESSHTVTVGQRV